MSSVIYYSTHARTRGKRSRSYRYMEWDLRVTDGARSEAKHGGNWGSEQWALYIYGVRSSGHRVKPNMAANWALSYVSTSLLTRSFMFTCYVKTAQGDGNRRNSGLHVSVEVVTLAAMFGFTPWSECILSSLVSRLI